MESDGVEESFEGLVRVAVTAGARFGENMARMREQMARETEARSLQESRELQARTTAERKAAVSELGNIQRGEWWDKARPEDIGRTYATAKAWEGQEPEAASARLRMESELRTRYGVEVENIDADPAQVQAHLARMEAERIEGLAAEERRKESQEREEAAALMHEGDRLDVEEAELEAFQADLTARLEEASLPENPWESELRSTQDLDFEEYELSKRANAARDESGKSYDSAERRSETAASLEGQGFAERSVEARKIADVSQGKPATEAVKNSRAVKARKGRARVGFGKQSTLDR